MIHFIDAEAKHADLLRDLVITSKSYWGYSQERLEQWRFSLGFKAEYISRNTVKLVFSESEVIGFFALVKGDINELDHLWLYQKPSAKAMETWYSRKFYQNAKDWVSLSFTSYPTLMQRGFT